MQIREIKADGFLWLDINNPTVQELEKIGLEYKLDPTTLIDCMEPEHLPKYEVMEDVTFIILRAYDLTSEKKADTVQKITNKVAIFFSQKFLITIHRTDLDFINQLFEKVAARQDKVLSTHAVANSIMFEITKTYEIGLDSIYQIFESFEQDVFGKSKRLSLIQSYLLKRRIDIMGRLLMLMKAPFQSLMASAPAHCRMDFKNTKEHLDKVQYLTDVVHDNLASLLSLQISLQSQATNEASFKTGEVMRVLTIISLFFMPLNFIVGFYGMNFPNLPMLNWPYGYEITLLAMFFVSLMTYLWLRTKKIIK